MRLKSGTLIAIGLFVGLLVTVRAVDRSHRHGATVQVSAVVTDTSGGTLSYRWRSTDGQIDDVDAASTSWTLPRGPGLHFAYVLVSNGLGGYTERRIAVNTDTLGSDDEGGRGGEHEEGDDDSPPYKAPPAPAQQGDYYRSHISGGALTAFSVAALEIDSPDYLVYIKDNTTGATYPPTGPVKTNLSGEYSIPNLPAGNNYTTFCAPDAVTPARNCTSGFFVLSALSMPAFATTDYLSGFFPGFSVSGSLALQDGSPCGTVNKFFGVEVTATASAFDKGGTRLAGPVRLNELGYYAMPLDPSNPNLGTVSVQCENAPPVSVAITAGSFSSGDHLTIAGVGAPVVVSMAATRHGATIASVNFLSPPPPALPSDIVSRADAFLAEKGLDSRLGACQYYKAIGAVRDCDAAGNLIGAISYQDWQRAVKIGPYATGATPTFTATYINKVDLNLTRVHRSITYGPDQTAAVVCNHLGATDFFNPTQADIDTAVDNAAHNRNLVACVAMDYIVSSGVNGNLPFIRFLIFGPSGELLPSVNLDGRREKFVPGTCVVCHGGDHYAGAFPENGSGYANVGGHFLPYDAGNFEFSSRHGLRQADQEQAIYNLNQNVLNAGPTPAEQALIGGWYAGQGPSKVLDQTYIDPSWPAPGTAAHAFYEDVYARSCRTCHVALVEGYNFDHFANITPGGNFYRALSPEYDVGVAVCGGDQQILRDHSMANSLVTFNRFWLTDTARNVGGLPDQPAELTAFLTTSSGSTACPQPPLLLP